MTKAPARPWRIWASVALLMIIYCCAFVDRQLMSLLVSPIKSDLHLDDLQIGLVQGLALAVFYAVLGLPVGRWVDRGHRPAILAFGVIAWSFFTALSGAAADFWSLFVCRVGVGIGEATVVPVTYSLIADYFDPTWRGRALGAFGTGVYVGSGLALILGGALLTMLNTTSGAHMAATPWRTAFLIAAAPGVLLGLLCWLIIEPRGRVPLVRQSGVRPAAIALMAVVRRNLGPLITHHIVTALLAAALYALLAWTPELMRRHFGLTAGRAGSLTGFTILVTGVFGVLGGGGACDILLARGVRGARVIVMISAALLALPFAALLFSAKSPAETLAAFGVLVFCLSTLTAAGPAGITDFYPETFRGVGSAIFQFVVTLIGLGAGPTLVPLLGRLLPNLAGHLSETLAVSVVGLLTMAIVAGAIGLPSYARVGRSM